jgi:hypothetical protein
MTERFIRTPIHQIPIKRDPVATDELEGQTQNGGDSFRNSVRNGMRLKTP